MKKVKSFDEAQEELAQETKEQNNKEVDVHLSHCYQGPDYEDSCKYGDDENCPAKPKTK